MIEKILDELGQANMEVDRTPVDWGVRIHTSCAFYVGRGDSILAAMKDAIGPRRYEMIQKGQKVRPLKFNARGACISG